MTRNYCGCELQIITWCEIMKIQMSLNNRKCSSTQANVLYTVAFLNVEVFLGLRP